MSKPLPTSFEPLLEGREPRPFTVLGAHRQGRHCAIRVLIPGARAVELAGDPACVALRRVGDTDLFAGTLPRGRAPAGPYQVRWQAADGIWRSGWDAYSFRVTLPEFDVHLFNEGRHWHVYRLLGAHVIELSGITGVRFATWAPHAERVSVIGDFNDWHGLRHPMQRLDGSGVWVLFIPGLTAGALYKYEIRGAGGGLQQKGDPYGQRFELRPKTASRVAGPSSHHWQDGTWIARRRRRDWLREPMSIYEVHLGSWQRAPDGGFLDYRDLAHRLVDYVVELGFTHIELLPVTEHPLDDSWGYQTTGYFAATARFGEPDGLRYLVDYCHRHDIGVILDWAPAHFPRDAHALARYDGRALYEHEDPRRGEHRDWGTLIYDYGRPQVRNFLLASANFWLEEFHIDGLRVDAVASMLYLDYSRAQGDWLPNQFGGNENLEAVTFLRQLNELTHGQHPGTVTIAEESTAWPQVTRPTWLGGLGFSMKWNMGWMHDTLSYLEQDPVYRRYHHDRLSFGILYAFSENFCLPFSHDEVVHGKRSLLQKMPGDAWQRFASLRLLYGYLFTYPGTKLLFMGGEFAQLREWNANAPLDWDLAEQPGHSGVRRWVADLNRSYRSEVALYRDGFSAAGFEWVDCHDSEQSVVSYLRRAGADFVLVVLNFTPVPRHDYRLGVPGPGRYCELLNSDSRYYGGSDVGNGGELVAEPLPWMGRGWSLALTLPPLAALIIKPWAEE